MNGPRAAAATFNDVVDAMLAAPPEAKCLVCGCTDLRACPGGCSWAEIDRKRRTGLCSRCAARPDRRPKLTAEQHRLIRSYVRRGVTKNSIARMMGVSWSTVDRWSRRSGSRT